MNLFKRKTPQQKYDDFLIQFNIVDSTYKSMSSLSDNMMEKWLKMKTKLAKLDADRRKANLTKATHLSVVVPFNKQKESK